MTVTTSIARHYAIKHVVLIVVSIAFSFWGAYDLWIKLPREQQVADRFAELMTLKEQIEKDLESGTESTDAGIVFNLASFFSTRDIDIAELNTRSYAAAHTGAPMFAVQMTINVPAGIQIAALRDEFMEFCDQLNLDAIMEPVKG